MDTLSSMGTPVVDISCCILCEICMELAPHAFAVNDAGFVEVLERDDYSDEDIREAIKNCPKDCITRE
ncbi:MAG: ferredoxin [Desulfobacterales bacterium]|nr:ferredoxin [Desulfobacterales bacterium]